MEKLRLSRPKRYLTGMDWIVHVFHYMNKRVSKAGNTFQIVLALDGIPAPDEMKHLVLRFTERFPLIKGRPVRAYNLAPYWELPLHGQNPPTPMAFAVSHAIDERDAFALLEKEANTPFNNSRDHLAFHLVNCGRKCFLAMRIDHRLFDAQGAEIFLDMLQHSIEGQARSGPKISLSHPPHLSEWREKFKAGKNVNRAFLRLSENAPPRVLPLSTLPHNLQVRFRLIPFGPEETARIIETAHKRAGYLLLMPYLLALSTSLFHSVFNARGVKGSDYIISVSVDTRPRDPLHQELFFNHLSFLLFRISAVEADDSSLLLQSIKGQMYSQIESGLPGDFKEASYLMRIVPLPILARLMRIHMKGEIASFSFSYVGESVYSFPDFMGIELQNLFHMPRVVMPPGLGIFFEQVQGKLNAVLSYAEGLLSEDEAARIVHDLQLAFGTQ